VSGTLVEETFEDPPTAPSSLTWLGERVADRYEIIRPLAKGAMGRVFVAIQHPLGRQVAVKVLELQGSIAPGDDYQQRFASEAATLAKLTHANTVRVIDFGTWRARPFLVMEYVPGKTLQEELAGRNCMDPEACVTMAAQVAGALGEAHSKGIVHRDLKPGNIVLGHVGGVDNVAKVIDFGLVALARTTPSEGNRIFGTPGYMAPEQIRGHAVDGRTDIYALGILMFRALTGRLPFRNKDRLMQMHAHLRKPPPLLEDVSDISVPPSVEWVIQTCLAKRPEDRFANAQELVAALEACLVTLRDPEWREARFALDDGHFEDPFSVDNHTPTHSVELEVAAPERRRASLPWARMAQVFAVAVLAGLIAGGVVVWGTARAPEAPVETTVSTTAP
jgi:serine/threonine-protein kinase